MSRIERVPCDARRLTAEIRLLIEDCIHLKRLLGSRWTRPMAEEQQRLVHTRRKLTERFVLLAASRGRLHVIHVEDPIAHAMAIIGRLVRDFEPTVVTQVSP
jgi:hypothetical protein